MNNSFIRTEMLLGSEAMEKLAAARVAVFGVGGVGGYVCEALARSGVGALDLIDHDTVSASNLNRQIIALNSTVGQYKTDVMRERIADIDPEIRVHVWHSFFLPENRDCFDFDSYSYMVDAVDTVTAKLELARISCERGIPLISAMGTGNKLDPSRLRISDISQTHTCPLARTMRRELRRRGIPKLTVVWSDEEPITPIRPIEPDRPDPERGRKDIPGSSPFVPSAAGLLIASKVVRDLIGR